MPLLSVEVVNTLLPVGEPYAGSWAGEAQVKQSGTTNVWLPIRDLNGLSDAITSLARIEGTERANLSTDERAQRRALLQVARKIIEAERELLLRDFAKLLGNALASSF